MAERNKIKLRTCKRCGEKLVGKASKLMEHYEKHGSMLKMAAEAALMSKIQMELAKLVPGLE